LTVYYSVVNFIFLALAMLGLYTLAWNRYSGAQNHLVWKFKSRNQWRRIHGAQGGTCPSIFAPDRCPHTLKFVPVPLHATIVYCLKRF